MVTNLHLLFTYNTNQFAYKNYPFLFNTFSSMRRRLLKCRMIEVQNVVTVLLLFSLSLSAQNFKNTS